MERLKKIDWSNVLDNTGLLMVLIGAVIIVLLFAQTMFTIAYKEWTKYPLNIRIGLIALLMVIIGGVITYVARLLKSK